jgi:hypothetical protein
LAHTLLSIGLAFAGIVLVLRSPDYRPFGILCLAALGYSCVAISLFGFDAYFRCRFPVLPFLYLFAGIGASRIAANSMDAEDMRLNGASSRIFSTDCD